MIITIDGPVASGKSTVSRILAHRLGYYYLCSGLLYRTLSYVLITFRGYTLETLNQLKQEDIEYCFDETHFSYCYDKKNNEHIFFNGQDITSYLKAELIDKVASIISINRQVRDTVTKKQHTIAAHHNIVTDGRDVGSVVFSQAEYKFFVTASIGIRAERWRKDQKKYGVTILPNDAVAIITDRDERDKNRVIAPLIVPEGAIVIDTSELSIEQTIEKMLASIKNY
jgi:cytidylate kinase